jgi:oxidase EvaA
MKSLIRSLLTTNNPFNSTDEVLAWIERRNREVKVNIEGVPFSRLNGWRFDPDTGNLCHESGKFFSIVGIDVYKNQGGIARWRQPIINQPEVGYLGIICKEFDGILYFLLQAKIEPGNVNCVQLSPTLQATRSNYTCVHGGKRPAYLDYFKDARQEQILLDQLQSEQGARFFRKRNRNIIIRVDDDIDVGEDFRWLTLGQIKQLMLRDNTVNMDTRTVLSGLRFQS